jgi:dihydrofolate synthase/folylpolyglutamate synthase
MGGRLDATNVVEPCVSVITDISLDHQKFLGNTITEIAREKAGIIRQGGIIVTLPQHPEANDVIGNTILDRQAHAISAVPYVPPVSPGASQVWSPRAGEPASNVYPLNVMGQQITVSSTLAGRHQLRNVALAIAAAEQLTLFGFAVTPAQIEQGIRATRWPGRFQVVPARPDVGWPEAVVDVAHNPAGAWALRSTLSERYEGPHLTFVFGAMRDKAIAEMAEILFPLADQVIATRAGGTPAFPAQVLHDAPANPRVASPEDIQHAAARTGADIILEPTVEAALGRARQLTRPDGVIVVTGSIYVVGEALQLLEAGVLENG